MRRYSEILTDKDLGFITNILLPHYKEPERLIAILRQDEDILEGMLKDQKLFNFLIKEKDLPIKVSPQLFFLILLIKVKEDFQGKSFTIEKFQRQNMVIFDSKDVVELLNNKDILIYLANMLSSFVKINSYSVLIRLRKGIWRRYRFSDFDIKSLIRYSEMVDEEMRFSSYKRIGDICLFISGVFPEYISEDYKHLFKTHLKVEIISQLSREGYIRHGEYYYKKAAQLRAAQKSDLAEILEKLSENFTTATKPLSHMSNQYLGLVKTTYFFQ